MKNIAIIIFLFIYSKFLSQENTYNVFEIGKGEIFKQDYCYINFLFDNYYSATLCDKYSKTWLMNSTGIINDEEKIILPFKYNKIEQMWDSEASKNKRYVQAVNLNDKKGFCILEININSHVETVVEEYFAYRYFLFDDFIISAKTSNTDMVNLKNHELKKTKYSDIEPLNRFLAVGKIDGKNEIINKDGNLVSDYKFDYVRKLTDSLILVRNKDSIGIIDTKGNLKIPMKFKKINNHRNILIVQTYNSGKPLKLNDTLKNKVSDYSIAINKNNSSSGKKTYYSFDLENPKQNGKYGVLNSEGYVIVPFLYEIIEPGINNNLIASKNNLFGIISNNNQTILQHKFSRISVWNNKFYITNINNNYGLINENLKEIIPLIYNKIVPINDSNFFVLDKTQWYKITVNSEKIISKNKLQFDYSYKIENMTSPREQIDHVVSEEYFLIKKNELYGVISNNMNLIIPIKYNQDYQFAPFKNNHFEFTLNGNIVLFTLNGILLKDIECHKYYNNQIKKSIICKKNGKYGLVDQNGLTIIPFNFQEILSINEERFIIKK